MTAPTPEQQLLGFPVPPPPRPHTPVGGAWVRHEVSFGRAEHASLDKEQVWLIPPNMIWNNVVGINFLLKYNFDLNEIHIQHTSTTFLLTKI